MTLTFDLKIQWSSCPNQAGSSQFDDGQICDMNEGIWTELNPHCLQRCRKGIIVNLGSENQLLLWAQ